MKRVGLRLKFAVLFIMVVTVVLGAAGLWSALSQQKQAEKEMLEKAQVLAQEMDAVWTFFETNQHQFKTDERGNYELYCVVAAKSVRRRAPACSATCSPYIWASRAWNATGSRQASWTRSATLRKASTKATSRAP